MSRVRTSSHRETPSKCRRCLGHGIQIPVKGHAATCPFRLCDCSKCQKVVCRRISSSKNRLKNKCGVVFVKMRCLTGNVRVHAVCKDNLKCLKSSNVVSLVSPKQKENRFLSEPKHDTISPSTSASTSPQLVTKDPTVSAPFPTTLPASISPFCMPPMAPLSNPLFNLEALIHAYRLNLSLFSPQSCGFPLTATTPALMPVPIPTQRLF
uniref:DM domain-containing protein n=1 Tax=Panagrolaimus superbus TaxID=310955 RepID=A0A914Z4C4_9BILA